MRNQILGIILILALYLCKVHGIVGYDCGSSNLNVTTLSLLNVGECEIPHVQPNISQTYIQLLQISKYDTAHVIQCKIVVRRTITYCGMHSHASAVLNGEAEYLTTTSRDVCQQMHATGEFNFNFNHRIYGLKVNSTATKSVVFAGSITSDGKCSGSGYLDEFGSWDNVVVQGTITIALRSYYATISLNTDRIYLRSGTVCQLSETSCIDIDGGYTYWNSLPRDHCQFNQYDILYEGLGNKMTETITDYAETIYSLATKDITSALAKKGEENICGYTIIKTEHPKLVIFETRRGESFATRRKIAAENLDIFAYVNSKFIYVEKHVKTQMNQLYKDVITQRCNLEQQVLRNALSIATQNPEEFAYHLMKGPGYMAVVAGEVVHIIKCIPVEVKIKQTEECYHQMPVLKANETFFLSPRTHILMKTGTQTSCNPFIPSMYYLANGWYKFIPKPVETIPPPIMKPMTKPTWIYVNPSSLATSGIYSEQDLEKLRDHIMFPAERPAVLNTIARGAVGEPISNQGISFSNLLDEASMKRIVESAWNKLWGGFVTFGTASAGLIGLYFATRIIKLIVDTAIHGYTLHTIYGWSIHLLGALWDSVTHLLLHLANKEPDTPSAPPSEIHVPNTSEKPITIAKETTSGMVDEKRVYPQLPQGSAGQQTSPTMNIAQIPNKNDLPNYKL